MDLELGWLVGIQVPLSSSTGHPNYKEWPSRVTLSREMVLEMWGLRVLGPDIRKSSIWKEAVNNEEKLTHMDLTGTAPFSTIMTKIFNKYNS